VDARARCPAQDRKLCRRLRPFRAQAILLAVDA
jgi:hypothetical protein